MTTNKSSFTERYSVILKVAAISVLILLLLIPTSMIRGLITERQQIQNEAMQEVGSKWGREQTLTGPVLIIPYQTFYIDKKGEIRNLENHKAYFLPDQLNITGVISPEVRYRGIFQIAVYNSKLHFSGTFNAPELSDLNSSRSLILWDKATVSFGISDMRGIKDSIKFIWNNNPLACEPDSKIEGISNSGITSRVPNINNGKSKEFSFDISLNGSKNISFIPVGKETRVRLNSSWSDPSFDGAFLPDRRTISKDGFEAEWKILQFNRDFPQKWYDRSIEFAGTAFGVSLLLPVDTYHVTDRSIKYAILIISLTFVGFFFIEILKKLKVHPIQYILVGLGLCLFYLLLLSLCEQISFGLSYLIAAVVIIGLIAAYSKSVFKKAKLAFLFSAVLSVLYGFIYVLLQLQDYALLMGSFGLLFVLAAVMYLSRKIDWYAVGASSTEKEV